MTHQESAMSDHSEAADPGASGAPFDAVVVGGGPAGSTAATDLARQGLRVALLDKAGRIKPCGGAIPPKLIEEFDIPDHLIVARARSARITAPSGRSVDMPIDGGFVGMVDRGDFDEWLRQRAAQSGATRLTGQFKRLLRPAAGCPVTVIYETSDGQERRCKARLIIGADGAKSTVGKAEIRGSGKNKCVFAYHEVIRSPKQRGEDYDPERCDIHYTGQLSPDFYSWIFPHGETASVGTGTAVKGVSMRAAVKQLRAVAKLDGQVTERCEGAPIPLKPLKKWDNGRDVILAGDAAGVVAPASGEGIYYAMASARMVADSAAAFLQTGDSKALAHARKAFMKQHGKVFWVLGLLQDFWYSSDKRRERFTTICADPDVQKLTWEAYMNKRLVRRDPLAHIRIFLKDLAHLLHLVPSGERPTKEV